jgi:hypothetical protein
MLSPERIAAITAIQQAATLGPWDWDPQDFRNQPSWATAYCGPPNLISTAFELDAPIVINRGCAECREDNPFGISEADRVFITDARTAVPELLTERAELLARIDDLESALLSNGLGIGR